MKCLVFVCLCFTAVARSASLGLGSEAEWETYKVTYGKQYSPDEDGFRKEVWRTNLRVSA
jgi:hypothetical protein